VDERQEGLVLALAAMPETAKDLLRRHGRQDDGHCGVCRGGNVQSGRVVHPCTLYTIATTALVERVRIARAAPSRNVDRRGPREDDAAG
jgi:hypothetical protein